MLYPAELQGRGRYETWRETSALRPSPATGPSYGAVEVRLSLGSGRATQPDMTRAELAYYVDDRCYRRLGITDADQDERGNTFPCIYQRDDGQALILSGHHRSAAALITASWRSRGSQRRGRLARGDPEQQSGRLLDPLPVLAPRLATASLRCDAVDRCFGAVAHPQIWPYIGRTPEEGCEMATRTRTRDRRLEVRTTTQERDLIDRAAEASGTDLTSFVVEQLTEAARRVLADRDQFVLTADASAEWDRINRRSAKDLAGLRRLMARPSPFAE